MKKEISNKENDILENYVTTDVMSIKWGRSLQSIQRLCRLGVIKGAVKKKQWYIPINAKEPLLNMEKEGYLTTSQLADKWGVCRDYIGVLIKRGKISGAIKENGNWYIPENTLSLKERRIIEGTFPKMAKTVEESLAYNSPELIKEWDFERNGIFTPYNITKCSGKKVWWICDKKHSYPAYIFNRVAGKGCPLCAGLYAIEGENDLKTLYPDIVAKYWDYEKNVNIDLSKVKPQSSDKAYWKCLKCGESFSAKIYNIVNREGRGCPFCSRHKVVVGETDLLSVNPELASEWDYDKNRGLIPQDYSKYSHDKVWWKCSICSHSWRAKIGSRTMGSGCPKCYKR